MDYQIRELLKCKRPRDIETQLKQLPSSLYDHYEHCLKSINQRDYPEALKIFMWLISAKKPMTWEELAEAAIIQSSEIASGKRLFDPANRLLSPSEVLHICGSLIVASPTYCGQTSVRFAHFSVKEYLLSGKSSHFPIVLNTAENHVYGSCVSYLILMKGIKDPDPTDYPLLEYAAEYWCPDSKLINLIDPLVESLIYSMFREYFMLHSFKWLRYFEPFTNISYLEASLGITNRDQQIIRYPGPLFYAVHHRLYNITEILLLDGWCVDELHAFETDFLPIECFQAFNEQYGSTETWEWADGFSRNRFQLHYSKVKDSKDLLETVYIKLIVGCQTALLRAVEKNHIPLVNLLLAKGANPNVGATSFSLRAKATAKVDHQRDLSIEENNIRTRTLVDKRKQIPPLVKEFLPRNMTITGRSKYTFNPTAAKTKGQYEVCSYLLGENALIHAVMYETQKLRSGPSYPSNYRFSNGKYSKAWTTPPITKLIHSDVVENLKTPYRHSYDEGAALILITPASKTPTPLGICMMRYYVALSRKEHQGIKFYKEMMKRLIQAHASPYLSRCSAIYLASLQGDLDTVRQLVQTERLIDAIPGFALAELLCIFASQGSLDTVEQLLQTVMDVGAYDAGFRALLIASEAGHCSVVKALLPWNTKYDHLSMKYGQDNPLIVATKRRHYDIVKLLLENGAEVNTFHKSLSLMIASEKGYCDMVVLLLEHHAEVITRIQNMSLLWQQQLVKDTSRSLDCSLPLAQRSMLAKKAIQKLW